MIEEVGVVVIKVVLKREAYASGGHLLGIQMILPNTVSVCVQMSCGRALDAT
jgi:hypothetical protein